MASYKAYALAQSIAQDLTLRGTTALVSFNDAGNPSVTVGTLAANSDCGVIVISGLSELPAPQNILGQAAELFTPHLAQVVWESVGGASVATQSKLLAAAVASGLNVEVRTTADGTAPATTASVVAAATLQVSLPASAQYPLAGQ